MKKITLLLGITLYTLCSFAAPIVVNEKVLKVFHQTFKNPENVVWTDAEHSYMVQFTLHGIRNSVKYDEEGNFLSAIRYYQSDLLPLDIHSKLKKRYPEKTIFGITEQTIGDEVYYYIKLEDQKYWTTVKIDNYRNLQVTEKYQKAD